MPTPEEIEDVMGSNYEDFLLKQTDCHLIGQLEGVTCVDPLEDFEIKLIVKMIQARDFAGKGNVHFEDIRRNSF